MFGRLKSGVIASALVLVALPLAGPSTLHAQQQDLARFRVLIPDLFPQEGADDDFGRDLAEDVRDAVDRLPTHQAIERDEIRDNLRRLEVRMEDLNCISTRQLGPQVNAKVAMCANYTELGNDQVGVTDIQIIDLSTSASFPVDDITVDKDDTEVVAEHIVAAFDRYIQQDRYRTFCYDYSSEQNQLWEDALRNCDQALELNPEDEGVLYQRSYVLFQMDSLEAALESAETVLETNGYHEDALQLAGYLASTLGDADAGREYYSRYLELNPGAIDVRRRIAYEMGVEAGEPAGAVVLIQEGLESEPGSIPLLTDLANYSFSAARTRLPEGFQPGPDNPVPGEVADYYDQAIDAYLQVFEARGDSMEVGSLRNVILAQVQMNRLEEAVTTAEQVLETFPGEAVVWSTYADALRRLGRIDEAVEALQAIEEIDPNYPDLYARQGNILLAANRRDDAIRVLGRAVREGGADPNQVSRIIFADAHSKGIAPEQKNWSYALEGIEAARQFEGLSDATLSELNFWQGYALFNVAIQAQAPATVESAQRALPMFRRVKELMSNATSYVQQRNLQTNVSEINNAADQYIEIQDAIIRRGG